VIPSVAQCKTEFEQARRRRRSEPMQFSDIRWEALDRFLLLGFPTTQDEAWRFTSVDALAEEIFTLSTRVRPTCGPQCHTRACLWRWAMAAGPRLSRAIWDRQAVKYLTNAVTARG
jgi:hypothetical protein